MSTLKVTMDALEHTLVSLSGRLTSSTTTFTDPQTISSIVESITKTTQALGEVKKLQWSERRASFE
jgi:hypothetical protein